MDVEGVLRGKIMSKAKLLSSVKSEGFNFCSVIFGWDSESTGLSHKQLLIQIILVHDQAYNKELLVANWDNGYRDLFAIIDLSTFRRLKWEKDIPFFLCRFVIPETGEILPVDPRSLIAKVTDKGKDMGYKCMSGAEFEVSWNPVWTSNQRSDL